MYRKNIRFINTFRDLDLMEYVIPYCMSCGHAGRHLVHSYLPDDSKLDDLIIERKDKLYCIQCKCKEVGLRLESNPYMPGISRKYLFSDNICRMYRISRGSCRLPFEKTTLH